MNLLWKFTAAPAAFLITLLQVAGATVPYDAPGSGIKAPGGASGFFRTEKVDGRWWFVDPNGELFFALGTDWVNADGFNKAYTRIIKEKYGTTEKWAAATVKRLKSWGMNHLGTSNTPELRGKGLAYSHCADMGGRALRGKQKSPGEWKKLPNVFHPDWAEGCREFAKSLTKTFPPDDPWLFGFYIDNELQWYGKKGKENSIFLDTMEFPADHSAKKALVEILKREHGTIAAFNRAWHLKLQDWDRILELKTLVAKTPEAKRAETAFLTEVADRYFKYTAAAFREFYPNHLVLGARIAGNAPAWVWQACGRYCDAVSFNNYPSVDLVTGRTLEAETVFDAYAKLAGDKPLMLTEWSFPAYDSGLPCKKGAGMRVDTQTERARAAEILHRMVIRKPYFAASNFFMWVDEPARGFGEDCNYGLVNEKDEPYELLTSMFARLNPDAVRLHLGAATLQMGIQETPVSELGVDLEFAERDVEWTEPAARSRQAILVRNTAKRPVMNLPVFLSQSLSPEYAVWQPLAGTVPVGGGVSGALLFDRLEAGMRTLGVLYPAAASADRSGVMMERNGDGFVIDNGLLRLERDGDSGNMIDRVLLGGKLLGGYQALLWQVGGAGKESWSGCSSVTVGRIVDCAPFLQVDLTAAGSSGKIPFSITHRLTVWRGSPVFAVRLIAVLNRGEAGELSLKGSFFQFPSRLGGDQVGDEHGRSGSLTFYCDREAGLRYGCTAAQPPKLDSYTFTPSIEPQAGEPTDAYSNIWGLFTRRNAFRAAYWGKAGVSQHADAFVTFPKPVKLAPGQEFRPETGPDILVFGADESNGLPQSWEILKENLAAWEKLDIQAGPVRKR